MGQEQAAAVTDIDRTRRRLDSELDELATYLPPTAARVKRVATIAAAFSAATALFAFAVRKRREHRTVRHLRAIDARLERLEDRLHR